MGNCFRGLWRLIMIPKDIEIKAKKHNEICNELRAKGYTIQGCGNDFSKCWFADGKKPFEKIIGYIDNKTLEVVYTD